MQTPVQVLRSAGGVAAGSAVPYEWFGLGVRCWKRLRCGGAVAARLWHCGSTFCGAASALRGSAIALETIINTFRTTTLYLDWGLQLRCQAAFASLQHCVAQSRYNVLFLNVFIILVQMSTADPSLRTML